MTTGCCCLVGPCPWRHSWQWAHLCEHLGGKNTQMFPAWPGWVFALSNTPSALSQQLSLCSLLSLEQGSSRNGFWWEKSQKSFSGSWDEREKGSKCFTQIKQPKKNKGRKKRKAMTSIFFLVNFFHFLSRESKNWNFWQGTAVGREFSVPLHRVAMPGDMPYPQAVLVAVRACCLLGSARACVVQRGQGCLGMGLLGKGQTAARVPPSQCFPSPQALSAAWCGLCPLSPGGGWVAQRCLCLNSVNCQLDPGN